MNKLSIELSENNVGCYVNTNLKNINEEQTLEIKKLLNKHGVLFFKDQNLSPEEYISFANNLVNLLNIQCSNQIKTSKTFMSSREKKDDKI